MMKGLMRSPRPACWLLGLLLIFLSGCAADNKPAVKDTVEVQEVKKEEPQETVIDKASQEDRTQEAWRFGTQGRITSSPLVYENAVYFGSDDGKLYAVSAQDGKELWSFDAGGMIRSSPKLTELGTVVFQNHGGIVYALDAKSGAVAWEYSGHKVQGEAQMDEWDYYDASASVDGDRIYIGSANGMMAALQSSTGALLWQFKAGAPIKATAAHDEERVYVGDWNGKLYALDNKTGKLSWEYQTKPNLHHKAIQSTPWVEDGTVYLGGRNFSFYALHAAEGTVLWERHEPAWVASPVYADGKVLAGNSNGTFMEAVEPETGEMQWKFMLDSNVLAAPAVADGVVYFGSGFAYETGTRDEYLYGVEFSTGELKWKHATGKMQTTPAVQGDKVYYTGFDGALHAVRMNGND
ncbi:PQQ-binding-like beta-propeller repeat protein [Paenibacillus oenotherae]|uniref:PQQ-binding-like beta-propeller repeat protein n=1 Tax=Paenibacillus oenotherae TaxID=1435645 RepID=A0ABS7DEQ4_9BACL|nr:PQQ-binding-like beta-propeller repeat protein [Paenibacillus oenotherae]MBW7477638.1 PQQ-binding-like beta-propeller repeat protein [Paenibacillus oenotherae]